MEDIKPCPICGKLPNKTIYSHSVWYVCQEMGDYILNHRLQAAGKTEEEATDAWNRRTDV